MKNLRERSIKSVLWVGSTKLIGQAFSWLVTLLLVRILSPEDFGLMGILMSYQAVIILIYDLSLGEAILQKSEITEEDTCTCFWFTVAFGAVLTVFTWFVSPAVADFFNNDQLTLMLRISSIGVLCLSVKEIHTMLLRRNLEYDKSSKAQFFAVTIQLAVSLIMALTGFGVWSLVFGLLSFHFFHTLFTLFYTRWKPKLIFSVVRLRAMFRFAGPLVGTNLLWYTTHNSDSIIIGKLLGTDLLGYYRVAMDLSRVPINRFIKIIHEVCFPVFSKLQTDLEGLRSYFLKVVRYVALGSFPLFISIILFAEEIVYLILTPKWMPALNLLIIFGILGIMQSLVGIFTIVLKARGQVDILFKWSLALSILLPLFFLIMIPFGLEAVAISWLIVFPALFIYLFKHVLNELDLSVRIFLKNIMPVLISSGCLLVSVLFAKNLLQGDVSSWFYLIFYVIVGATAYIVALTVFFRDIIYDIKNILKTALSGGLNMSVEKSS